MTRPSHVVVDLDSLRSNYRLARRIHGGRSLAVIKGDAYGHGALACANALAPEADGFAVAFLDEARALREGGIANPILVLEGAFNDAELAIANALDLWLVVHHDEQIDMLARGRIAPRRLNVWLKIDSGMHRAGFDCADAGRAYERLLSTGKVRSITLMTHFARADTLRSTMTAEQIERFDAATRHLPGDRSLCNSAGLLWWPKARRDWARAGLMLYGIPPEGNELPQLQPAMTFNSRVVAVRSLRPGEPIGYNATYVAQRSMRVGLVCVGYADGYPQTAPSGTPIAVDGRRTSLVGRVSMDMLSVDLTDLPDAGLGSEVELWGRTIRVAEVAAACGRIPYELVCHVRRAPVTYRGLEATTENKSLARIDLQYSAG
ncbi:MAG: alanine racemase [Xanthomonadaceae bacterium]|nr:alanine racemase [Xanthomonadaceae bacterium]